MAMFWHDNLYLGKGCTRRAGRLRYQIANGLTHPAVYLITLPTGPNALLEMVPSPLLLQKSYPRDALTVVGMGSTRREGREVMRRILQDVYESRGDFDCVAYFRSDSGKE